MRMLNMELPWGSGAGAVAAGTARVRRLGLPAAPGKSQQRVAAGAALGASGAHSHHVEGACFRIRMTLSADAGGCTADPGEFGAERVR